MDADTRNRIAELHAVIRELRRELARIPSRTPTLPSALRPITVKTTSNNKTLGYGTPALRGAVWNATPFSSGVPLSSAYDPNSETTITDDGICYALDSLTGQSVLLVNRAVDGQSVGILSFDLPQGCVFLAHRQISVPVSGGTSVLAWEAYWA